MLTQYYTADIPASEPSPRIYIYISTSLWRRLGWSEAEGDRAGMLSDLTLGGDGKRIILAPQNHPREGLTKNKC